MEKLKRQHGLCSGVSGGHGISQEQSVSYWNFTSLPHTSLYTYLYMCVPMYVWLQGEGSGRDRQPGCSGGHGLVRCGVGTVFLSGLHSYIAAPAHLSLVLPCLLLCVYTKGN